MRIARCLIAIGALVASATVNAHPGAATAFAQVIVSGQTVRYSLALVDASRPGPTASDRLDVAIREKVTVVANGERCVPAAASVHSPVPPSKSPTATVDFACRGEVRDLTIRDDLPDALGADLHTLAKIEWPQGTAQFAFATEAREARIRIGEPTAATTGLTSFLFLGIEHIVAGWDHLLFLLVLVLGGGGLWSLIRIVTAFTVAHSITLALAVIDILRVPGSWIEPAIALTIAYVAAENLFARRPSSHRWALAFGFGLIHGFGFAAALNEIALPPGNLVGALTAFNVGVEIGQIALVVPLAAIVMRLRRHEWERKLAAAVSVIVLTIGVALFVERLAFAA